MERGDAPGREAEGRMKPTHAQIKALAGDPLLLVASEEQEIREEWKRMRRVYKAAMRWFDRQQPGYAMNEVSAGLHRACAAARKGEIR